jgi:hypothetical protein
MMDPIIKAKWIADLRSGNYKQARSQLRNEERFDVDSPYSFCCLGVLCETMGADWTSGYPVLPDGTIMQMGVDNLDDGGSGADADGYLSLDVLRIIGLGHAHQQSLADMNDDGGASFETIADYIEANL